MNDRQKIGKLTRELKLALDALDDLADWNVGDAYYSLIDDPSEAERVRRVREVLAKIRGGDGRPKYGPWRIVKGSPAPKPPSGHEGCDCPNPECEFNGGPEYHDSSCAEKKP